MARTSHSRWKSVRNLALTVMTVGSLLAVSACGSSSPASTDGGKELVFGVIDDLSGAAATIGTLDKKSTELAISEYNKARTADDPSIKVIFYDNKGDPATTAQMATRLITQDHAVTISCCASSSAAAAAAAVAGARKVPMLTSTQLQSLTAPDQKWHGYLFRTMLGNDDLAQANVDFAKGKGWNKIALSVSSLSYGKDSLPFFSKAIAAAGGTVVATTTLEPTATDASVQAAQIIRAQPDVVLTWDYPGPTAQLVKALRAAGSRVPVVSNWSAINETMTSVAGKSVPELYAHDNAEPSKPAVQTFASQWKAAYNEDPPINNFGVFGYNIAQVFIDAAKRAKTTDPEGVRTALQETNCLKTIVGNANACVTFGGDNYDGAKGNDFVVFKQFEDGSWVIKS